MKSSSSVEFSPLNCMNSSVATSRTVVMSSPSPPSAPASSSAGPPPTSAAAGSTQDADRKTRMKSRIVRDLQNKWAALGDSIDEYVATESEHWNEDPKDTVAERFLRAVEEKKGHKRLFVCCGGTWMNSSGSVDPLSNVARFARSVDHYGTYMGDSWRAIPQMIYYPPRVRVHTPFFSSAAAAVCVCPKAKQN